MSVFTKRGKLEYPEEIQREEAVEAEKNQQQTQPAYDTEFGMTTHSACWY